MPKRRAVTFYFDDDSGEMVGCSPSDRFLESSALMQADVWFDIAQHASVEKERTFDEFVAEAKRQADAS